MECMIVRQEAPKRSCSRADGRKYLVCNPQKSAVREKWYLKCQFVRNRKNSSALQRPTN